MAAVGRELRTDPGARLWALGVALITVSMPVAVLMAAHAFDLPVADDWAYARIVASFAQTGNLQFIGWNDVGLVGQVVWGAGWVALLGPGMATAHVAGIAAAVAGLLGAFGLFRKFIALPYALMSTAAVGLSPLYALLSGTFMTDIPAFAAEMWCLYFGVSWVRSRRWAHAAASLTAGCAGFTIRESSLSAVVAVLAAALAAARSRRERLRIAAAAFGLAAVVVGYYGWRRHLAAPGFGHPPQLVIRQDLIALSKAAMVVSLLALPVGVAAFVQQRRRPGLLALLLAGAAAVLPLSQAWYFGDPATIFPGNIIARTGAFGDSVLSGARPDLFGTAGWIAVQAIGIVSACLLFAVLLRPAMSRWLRAAPGAWIVALYGGLSLAFFLARVDTGAPYYDRYLIGTSAAVILVLAAVATHERELKPHAFAAGALALWVPALLSATLLTDSVSYSTARWNAGRQIVAGGIRPDEVDAGFEWSGAHHRGAIGTSRAAPAVGLPPALRGFGGTYTLTFGDAPCVVVADSPHSGLPVVRVFEYDTLSGLATRKLYEYRVPGTCRAHAPRASS